MSARAVDFDGVAAAGEGLGDRRGGASSVEDDGAAYTATELGSEESAHSAEVAVALFADGADEEDVAGRLDPCGAQTCGEREHGRESGTVVGSSRNQNAGTLALEFKRGVRGENSIEVGANGEQRSLSIAAGRGSEYIALGIRADFSEFERFGPEQGGEFGSTGGFCKRRSGNLNETLVPVAKDCFLKMEELECGVHLAPAGDS